MSTQRHNFSPTTWAVVLLGVGVIVLNIGMMRGNSSLQTYFDLRKSRNILQQTVQDLKKQNEELADEINRIRKSPSYAKKVLRDKYHVTDPDEDIVFFAE
jgi:cell division protein FtsB